MADYRIFRSLETQLREQIVAHLGDVDDRLIVIEDYLGNAPSGGIVFRYKYDDALAGDPGAGHAGADSLVHANVTSVRISTLTDAGNDITTFLQNLNIGDSIGMFEILAPNNTAFFQLTAAGVDQTGYFSFAVTPGTGGAQAMPSADEVDIDLYLVGDPARLMPPGGVDNAVLKKQSAADYDVDWELIPHDELTGVTTDQHHAQSHSHDGVDGSGQVQHDDTTGITPDNHHNQVHLLHGSDHSDVILDPLLDRHVLAVRVGGTDFAPEYRMNWRNTWGQQTYYRHDVVLDGPYTMVANKETTERAAPQNVGSPAWDMPDVPLWSNFANTSVVGSGHSYEFLETAYLQSIRVWPPSVGPDITYRLTTVREGSVSQSELTTLTPGEWNIIGLDNVLMAAGETLLVYLEALNSGGSTQVTGGWTRGANDNALEPANQSWNQNVQRTVLRIDFDDLDTVDRQIELEGITAGSTIQIVETAVNVNSITYQVVNPPITGLTSVSYDVIVIDEGVNLPTVGQPTTMTADVPVPQSTDFVGIVNGWVGVEPVYADVTSFLAFDGVDQGADPDNQYGVSILVQRISISPDWDLLALSGGGGGGGGGGGDPFPEAPADGQTYGRDGLAQDWSPVYTKTESADLLLGEAWPTGLFDGGELNIVAGPNIEIIAGAGVVVDSYTDPLAIPTDVHLSWDTQDQLITTPAVAGAVAYFTMADGAVPGPSPNTNLGVLTEYSSPPTQAQIRDQIFIGYVIFNGATWGEVSSPIVVNNSAHTLSDYLRWVTGPTRIIDGGKITEAALLTLDQAAGVFWEQNRNWHVNKKDPNRESFSATPNLMWRYVNRDMTSVSALTGTADPTLYDDGSPAPVPIGGASQACTVQRLYIDPRDNFWVLWGQNIYPTYLDAVANIGADTTNTEIPGFLQSSLLLGHIVAERVQTDWAPDMAEFVAPLDALGSGAGGGGGADTFLDLTDTPSDYAGHANKVTAVAGTEDALEFVTQIPEPAQSGLTYGRWWDGDSYEWQQVALPADIPTTYWDANGDDIVNNNVGEVTMINQLRMLNTGIRIERSASPYIILNETTVGVGMSLRWWTGPDHFSIGDQSGAVEWVTVLDSGEVGINTSAPVATLHVKAKEAVGSEGEIFIEVPTGNYNTHFNNSGDNYISHYEGGFTRFRSRLGGTIDNTVMEISDAQVDIIDLKIVTNDILYGSGDDGIVGLFGGDAVTNGAGINLGGINHPTIPGAIRMMTGGFNERLRIDNTGNVGIGTTAPADKLHIKGAGGDGDAGAKSTLMLGGDAANSRRAMIRKHNITNVNRPLEFHASVDATDHPLTFWTASDAERMRIDAAGNVGIGTSAPTGKLSFGSNLQDNIIHLFETGNVRYGFGVQNNELRYYTYTGAAHVFGEMDSSLTFNEVVRIESDTGQVGIGTTIPLAKLHVWEGESRITAPGGSNTHLNYNNSGTNYISHDSGQATIFRESTAEKMRIGSTVMIGATDMTTDLFNLASASTLTTGFRGGVNTSVRHRYYEAGNATARGSFTYHVGTQTFSFAPTDGNGDSRFGGFSLTNALMTVGGQFRVTSITTNSLTTGTVYSNAGLLTNTNPSDLNLKKNIRGIERGLDAILALNPVTFEWRDVEMYGDVRHHGLVAQEVEMVMPEIVSEATDPRNGETAKGLSSEQIVPVLIKAVQEQQATIDALTKRIEELENG